MTVLVRQTLALRHNDLWLARTLAGIDAHLAGQIAHHARSTVTARLAHRRIASLLDIGACPIADAAGSGVEFIGRRTLSRFDHWWWV